MTTLTDLELEERVAEIKGTTVHNCLSGGRSFPSYLEWRLLGPLMVEEKVDVRNNLNGGEVNINIPNGRRSGGHRIREHGFERAVLLTIIEAHKP